MKIERHTLHLDTDDLKRLAKIALEETSTTGIRVTAAGMIRRMIKDYLREHDAKTNKRGRR